MARLLLFHGLATTLFLVSCERKEREVVPTASPSEAIAPGHVLARADNGYPAGTRFIERFEMTTTLPAMSGEASVIVQHRDIRWEFQTADLLIGELLRDDMGSAEPTQRAPKSRPRLQGVPIRFVRTDGTWREQIPADLDLSPRDRTWLSTLAYDWSRGWDFHAYGTVPRAVGETWSTHDPAVFFNEPASYVSGVMKTTFKGVEEQAGRKQARLEGRFQFQGIADSAGYLTRYDLTGDILHALDDLMDIETRMKGTVEVWPPGQDSSLAPSQKAEVDFQIRRERLE